MITVKPADLDDARVVRLLQLHLHGMRTNTPPENVFALDLSGLRKPDITFLSAWENETLLGFGALHALSSDHGEIKSMRTAPGQTRKGVAGTLLRHLLDLAKSRSYRRVSLETGAGETFRPAHSLYERFGFTTGGPFASYPISDFSVFYHLDLEKAAVES